jgi:tetratricopeptide (TPR) repeat protein
LQACPRPVPQLVLNSALQLQDQAATERVLNAVPQKLLHIENGHIAFSPLTKREPTPSHARPIISECLRSYLSLIKSKSINADEGNAANIFSLARACETNDPSLVSTLFRSVEKAFKDAGNWRSVFEAANMSIEAAQQLTPSNATADLVSHAYVCGLAWVYQRVYQIQDANAAAEKAKQLADDCELHEMAAFCLKCLGRLHRIRAETSGNEDGFNTSIVLLSQAAKAFSTIGKMEEVGDSHSLLARTYLSQKAANFIDKAEWHARKAGALIGLDLTNKDYFDLQILLGDIEVASKRLASAVKCYNEALRIGTQNQQLNEIRARALLQRGTAFDGLKKKQSALHDFASAEKIWRNLDDQRSVAIARWNQVRLGRKLSKGFCDDVEKISDPRLRMAAVDVYSEMLAPSSSILGYRKAKPSATMMAQIMREARKRSARETKHWK